MHLPRRHHPEFAPAAGYVYPEQLRASLADLPAAPGVYLFHGDEPRLPLYIGKSVNLRQRVLAHLRNPEEDRMLRQTRRISHIRTAGDIGAQLLEARLIKTLQPLFNQRLRRRRQLCAWQLQQGRPVLVDSSRIDFATTPELYGLFNSRHAAQAWLRDLADAQRLCHGLLGLEKLAPGRGCFRAALRQCAGACRGDEPEAAHAARLQAGLQGLRLVCWPFDGAVGLRERGAGLSQLHVIHHWCYLGSVNEAAEAAGLTRQAAGFDADGYQILLRPLLQADAEIVPLG